MYNIYIYIHYITSKSLSYKYTSHTPAVTGVFIQKIKAKQ